MLSSLSSSSHPFYSNQSFPHPLLPGPSPTSRFPQIILFPLRNKQVLQRHQSTEHGGNILLYNEVESFISRLCVQGIYPSRSKKVQREDKELETVIIFVVV